MIRSVLNQIFKLARAHELTQFNPSEFLEVARLPEKKHVLPPPPLPPITDEDRRQDRERFCALQEASRP